MSVNWEDHLSVTVRVLEPADIAEQDKQHAMLLARAYEREMENLRAQLNSNAMFAQDSRFVDAPARCKVCGMLIEECGCIFVDESENRRPDGSAQWITWAWGLAGTILGAWIFALV